MAHRPPLWRRAGRHAGRANHRRRDGVATGAVGCAARWSHASGAGVLIGCARRAGATLAALCWGACVIRRFDHRARRTRLARKRRKKGGMTRPGAPDIPCGGGGRCRTERNGGEGRNRSGQLAPGVSYPRRLTIYSTNDIPTVNPWTGRSPRPAPCGPAGPRVPAHTHDNLYPSTSSTPPASNLGRRRNQENSHRASTRFSGVDPNSLEVARSQRSRGYRLHPCRADRRERPSRSHSYYLVRMTLPSSYTAGRMSQFYAPGMPTCSLAGVSG